MDDVVSPRAEDVRSLVAETPVQSTDVVTPRTVQDLYFDNINISGSGHAHLGPNINSYTVKGLIQVTQADVESLTGPLNVSTAAQGLTLVSTRLLVELGREQPASERSELYIAVATFRTVLRRVLPASLLSALSPQRAALIPAIDLIAVLTEAVLVFAEIEES
ncbi:hypothetical protein LTR95_009242, partial [Oleoguttula sp. CCFEE 5521]